jgi:thiamine biosynthesis lipoprotein
MPPTQTHGYRQAWTEMVMGLPVSVHLRSISRPDHADSAVRDAFERLRRADVMFSPFRSDSILSRFNRGEISLGSTPARFRAILTQAERAREMTDGAFDVRASGVLDPSGIVKGWAAEAAAKLLPVDHYLSAGGDMAMRSETVPWRIGIEHPVQPDSLVAVLNVVCGAVATSGSAHRGGHFLEPSTGLPASGIRQATVVGRSLTQADIWATALVARGARVLDRKDCLVPRLIGQGYELFIIAEDGETYGSPGFAAHCVPDQLRPSFAPLA